MFELIAIVVTPVPVKLPLGADLTSCDLGGCKVGQVDVLAGLDRERLRTGRSW